MQVSKDELSASYLDGVKKVAGSLSLFTNLLSQPASSTVAPLQAALAATESAAWRDRGSAGGWLAMSRLGTYLADAGDKVEIISSKKILLAGESGETPVSVQNRLSQAVQVRVKASSPSGSGLTIRSQSTLLSVPAGATSTVRISVHSTAIGTTTLQLQLVTQNGSPLSWTTKSLSVEVTRVGRFLLGIVGGALAILVLTSAYRLRRKRLARARQRDTASAGGAG
jgi:hypothetical protein